MTAAYPLNDIYPCVQGEGCQAGLAMVLVRLQGCAVGCPWCDTRETWDLAESHRVGSIAECLGTGPAWCEASADAIAEHVASHPGPRWVLLTGGEPADRDLAPLADAFHARGYRVAVETSGTATGHVAAGIDWVTVSPKVGMPGGKAVLPAAVAAADEIKMVVGKPADLGRLDDLLAACPTKAGAQVCLQPLSTNEKATALCVETVKARGWRLSLQMHKYLDER